MEVAEFLDCFFAVERYEESVGGVYRDSVRPLRRLGLALEPWPELGQWVEREGLDALFLHRPWKLGPDQLPADTGVLAYHLPFDEHLSIGFNPRLAQVLGIAAIERFGEREGRPLGMIGRAEPRSFIGWCDYVEQVFGGREKACACARDGVARLAVVGAMTDGLIRDAAEREAELYITGEWRQAARHAVQETEIGVIAVGHRRCEWWGLRALAGVVRERWSGVAVVLEPGGAETTTPS